MADVLTAKSHDDVILVPVNEDNWRALVALEICEGQIDLVSTNAVSLAECAARSDAIPTGIYAGERPVGLLVRCEREDEFELHRFMVACEEQGKGYARGAIARFLELGIAQDCPIVVRFLHWNKRAEKLYRAAGFVDTGEVNDEEEKVFIFRE
jgi:GNAT superfamily N-acetyltransferase